jgi:hypothetical protein
MPILLCSELVLQPTFAVNFKTYDDEICNCKGVGIFEIVLKLFPICRTKFNTQELNRYTLN